MTTTFVRTLTACFLSAILCTVAIAAPDVPTTVGTTQTFQGNQSAGVTGSTGIITVNVQNLNQPIAPASGVTGITLTNTSAGNVTINSGTAGPVVTITATGANADGILINSVGSPSAPANDPFLGIPIPGVGSAVGGGQVTVTSLSNITTSGQSGYGISASSSTSGYPGSVATALQNFINTGTAAYAFTLLTVDGTSADIGKALGGTRVDASGNTVSGTYSDTLELDANGGITYVPGSAYDNLALTGTTVMGGTTTETGTLYLQLTDTIRATNGTNMSSGTETLTGTFIEAIVKTVTITSGGTNTVMTTTPGSDFSALGSSAGIFPDLIGYVQSLQTLVGAGGAGNSVTVTNSGSIQTSGSGAHGIFATSLGGNGGGGRNASITHSSTQGGDGSGGGTVTVTANGFISTGSDNAAGVLATSLGGNGGGGGDSGYTRNAKNGGAGGIGGEVDVTGTGTIQTSGSQSSGILAVSQGGNGGSGGGGSTFNAGSGGGAGGQGGTVNVTGTWNITTTGIQAHGIWGKSLGGVAGGGGDGGWTGTGAGDGGPGSPGGSVTIASSGTIHTSGSSSYGIYGESVGGFGGGGGNGTSIFYASGGGGASAGSGGDVFVTQEAGGSVTTTGSLAYAIFAQSVGGGGGSGGGGAALVGLGGGGASGGTGGTSSIINFGDVTTTGLGSIGLYAQSIGGGGGDGGGGAGAGAIGGDGSSTSNGGNVIVVNTGTVNTTSNAIFAESIGGGGGNGGSAGGWFSFGGSGGGGGDAGTVAVTNNGNLTTTEANASAIFAQSVGGGGGNGGNSTAVGVIGSVAIGGHGAMGGAGKQVTIGVNPDTAVIIPVTGTISTSGANSSGIQAQSIGGGGGNGGFAFSASVSTGVSVSIGIGGTGGGGGAAGEVDVYYGDANSRITTTGTNAHGIFAQSVGGGGGSGGFAIAATGGAGTINASAAFGGSGGVGGDAGAVNVGSLGNPTAGFISTGGDHSYGIFAQSVGGGGGDGGFSVAGSASLGGVGASLSFGGSGTNGGMGNNVSLYSASTIMTAGNDSHGLYAQSVGGGGGSGGFSVAGGLSAGAAVDLSFGGTGGGGGNAGIVILNSSGSMITTGGSNSYGILAQSVGGGGGNGGFSVAGSISGGPAVNLSIGGAGGTASSGSSVTVTNSSIIGTGGNDSHGIMAESVGGGGGSGGFSVSLGISASPVGGAAAVDLAIGGNGGAGGSAGNVSVTNTGSMIMTGTGFLSGSNGNHSDGILAQSIGGGGGDGGFSVAGSISTGPAVSFSMGGSGGAGGDAGNVQVLSNNSIVITHGDDSTGIFAQSVGGGGGDGGFSVAGSISSSSGAVGASIGGSGTAGGSAGYVVVGATITGTSAGSLPTFTADAVTGDITTYGNRSDGILAQSVGGSGGVGGFSVAGGISGGGPTVNFSMGGSGGNGGVAADVVLDSASSITTSGSDAHAIFAQSVGGGGGAGGFSVTGGVSVSSAALGASIGGDGSAGGNAATVTVISSGSTISTSGNHSYGILAQSVGGGGGDGGFSVTGGASQSASIGFSMGGSGAGGGTSSIVSITNSSAIQTINDDSFGILAQSVGGGGGAGGFSIAGGISLGSGAVDASLGGKGGLGGGSGNVFLITTGSYISTGGDRSTAVIAQSIGGGGGSGGFSVAGGISQSADINFSMGGNGGSGGGAGTVTLSSTSEMIITTGSDSNGLFAQSVGGGGGSGGFSVTGGISTQSGALSASLGGGGAGGGNGNTVTVTSSGLYIGTSEERSDGILAQSVGGGGGSGGFSIDGNASQSAAIGFSMGGSGTLGGTGSTVMVTNFSNITTLSDDSIGILAQSVGGGGGSGGFSITGGISTNSSAIDASLGGKAGGGGAAGDVTLNSGAGINIMTGGDNSSGLVAQSIGGGGGAGGFSIDGGVSMGNNVNFSMGGAGGSGGGSGVVTLNNSSAIFTTGTNSDGLLAQSVGGGGGSGGFSIAGGLTTQGKADVSASVGGSGGSGGAGNTVNLTSSGTYIGTMEDHSDGIFAQSVGGGGGDGGFSVAFSASTGTNPQTNLSISVGGTGGSGGNGGIVAVGGSYNSVSQLVTADPLTGIISTSGSDSDGIQAQSIGGGGGNGGFSVAGSLSTGTAGGKQLDVSVGGSGGVAGTGSLVSVNSNATIFTTDDDSIGILAQSVGGGGGNGGMALAGAFSVSGSAGSKNLSIAVGGNGAGGGNGGEVDVTSTNFIETMGDDSHGILAQSIGGGGGNGGFSGAVSLGVSGSMSTTTLNMAIAIGGQGGIAGNGGNVNVTGAGGVTTMGDGAHAIFAQSVGGGGGAGGGSFAGTVSTNSSSPGTVYNISVAVGGSGGGAGTGGAVVVDNNGDLSTSGGGSHGIFAQSVGGGGGEGGSARSYTLALPGGGQMDNMGKPIDGNKQNKSLSLSIGGNGGSGNNGGTVTVSNTGSINTQGGDSYGVFAQSIGGGGGEGGNADQGIPGLTLTNKVGFFKSLSVLVGGTGGSSGNGSTVNVTQTGNITTGSEGSYGIFAQSVGGGGGIGGNSDIGFTGKVGIGGAGGASGTGGNVTVVVQNSGTNIYNINTTGDGADAIFAQSVGGGGGVAGNVNRGTIDHLGIDTVIGAGVAYGNSGGGGGDGGTVTVSSTTNIMTIGTSANGIFAQSVGGGGGLVGDLGNAVPVLSILNIHAGSVGAAGNAGTVNVTQTGNIITTGDASNGIYAQSAAGSGTGGVVTVNFTGIMDTTGSYSAGILAVSTGSAGASDITVTVSGSLAGGSGIGTGSSSAAGVQFVGGKNNTLNNETASLITTQNGADGIAIIGEVGNETVNNQGDVFGSVDLETGSNTFNNESSGLMESGSYVYLGVGNYFYNSGTISPGSVGTLENTALTGNYTETGNSTWNFDITSSFTSDLFAISGTASLGAYSNTVNLNELSIPTTSGSWTLITAPVGLTGSFQFGTMSGSTMPIGLTYTLLNSDTQELLLLNPSTGPFYWRGAADNAWNGDFVSGSSNWTSDQAGLNYIYGTPGVADDVFFSATNAINENTTLGADFIINSLTISDPNAVTIGGSNTLTLAAASGAGITVNSGAGVATISANVALGGNQSWTNNSSNMLFISGSTVTSPGNFNLTILGTGSTQISASIATGGGSLTKDGIGTLILYGTPNTYSGGTLLRNGTLVIANASAVGTGNLNLIGGVMTTTNDPATTAITPLHLNVGGSYTQTAPALLQTRIIGPSGVNDEIVVAGKATLGGTFIPNYSVGGYNPIPPAGNYTDAFDVLHSNVGVSGTFSAYIDSHYNPNKLLRWEPYYEPKDVMLEWVQYPFSSLGGLTFNQNSVANALDLELGLPVPPVPKPYNQSTGQTLDAHPGLVSLIYFLDNENLGNLPHDYDLIAPEELTSIFDISRSFADVQDANIADRLANLRNATPGSSNNTTVGLLVSGDGKSTVGLRDDDKSATPPQAPDAPRSDLFMEGNGDFVQVKSDSNAAGYNFTTGGVSVGGDYRVNNHFIIGLMGGYANTGATLTQKGSVDVESGNLGIYSTIYGGGFYLNSIATGGLNSYESHRIALGGVAQGKTDGGDFDALIGGGYDLRSGHFTLGPVVSAQYTYVGINGYTEMGSLAPLHIESQSQESLRTQAGFKISSEWNLRGVVISPSLTASWEHEFLDSTYALDSHFASGAGNIFTVKGPAIGRDGVVVNAGVNFQWTPRFGTYIYYNGELGRKNYQVNSVTGGMRLSF